MNKIREFLMKYHSQFCGTLAVMLFLLCLILIVTELPAGLMLLSLILIVLSLWCITGNSSNRMIAGYFLLGIAVYFFPAAAIAVPFSLGYGFRRLYDLWKPVLIVTGIFMVGMPGLISSGDICAPFRHLLLWLNRDNLFDHNISFWSLVTGREQLRFGLVAVMMTLGGLLLGFFLYQREKVEREDFLIWSAWTCLLFVPYGHAEDGIVLAVLLLTCKKLRESRLYQATLLLWLLELLLMLGSAYGGYERLGYDFYQMAVGINVMAWLTFSYRGFSRIWKND